MIHPQRLSKYITSRDCESTKNYLISFYDRLTPQQREIIKVDFNNNKHNKNE